MQVKSSLETPIAVAAAQYSIPHAEHSIAAVSELSDVFSPPHHGPRNVPIWVENVDHGDNFTHFPIINSDTYYLFLPHEAEEAEVFDMHYHGPSQQEPNYYPIELEALTPEELKDTPFKQGFKTKSTVIFNQSDPQPIAIHFSVRSEADSFTLKYIVVAAHN
ncbi:MAG: hypothetical protein AAFW00_25600 [Bacteroidota bacterium]